MQTCVYMSNCRIQAAVGNAKKGSISVKRLYETLAPEGCIINGVITAEEELAAHLKEFWKEKPPGGEQCMPGAPQLPVYVEDLSGSGDEREENAGVHSQGVPRSVGGRRQCLWLL